MNFVLLLFTLLLLVTRATSKTLTGVFQSFNSLTWEKAALYKYRGPQFPTWNAAVNWALDSNANAGDTFTLIMPCVLNLLLVKLLLI